MLRQFSVRCRLVSNFDLESVHRKRQLGCDDFITRFKAAIAHQHVLSAITILVAQFINLDSNQPFVFNTVDTVGTVDRGNRNAEDIFNRRQFQYQFQGVANRQGFCRISVHDEQRINPLAIAGYRA